MHLISGHDCSVSGAPPGVHSVVPDQGQPSADAAQQFDYMAAEEEEQDDEAGAKDYIDALVERTAPGCYAPGLAALASNAEAAIALRVRQSP